MEPQDWGEITSTIYTLINDFYWYSSCQRCFLRQNSNKGNQYAYEIPAHHGSRNRS